MGSDERLQLERANRYVVMAVQALLGLISPSMEAVGLQVLEDELVLWFWIRGDPADVEEDVQDAIVDLDAFLQPEDVLITSRIVQGGPSVDVGQWARMIYWAKVAE